MEKLFGTDGVRGVANRDLTPLLAMQLGMAAATVLSNGNHAPQVLVGRDTRLSGDMLEAALVAGLCAAGAKVTLLGILPTPAVAYCTKNSHADAGAVISASHNPFEDNGIKFFSVDGCKLPDKVEEDIEGLVQRWEHIPRARGEHLGSVQRDSEWIDQYIAHLIASTGCSLKGMRIVVDGANGAAYSIAPRVLSQLGAEVIPIHCTPNGVNINAGCGSLHTDSMRQTVKEQRADAGLSFDGDADRVIMSDERGNEVDGDYIMAMSAIHLKQANRLRNQVLVGTIMSNLGLEEAMKTHGIHLERTRVGDRYVAERMRELDAVLGGEQSGHIIFADYTTTGDGLLTALQVLALMQRTGKPLSQLMRVMEKYPQIIRNVKVCDKHAWEKYERKEEVEAWALQQLGNPSRVNIRPSGTEPVVRIMIEATDLARMEQVAAELERIVLRVCGEPEE
ncbi:MAG: phosphoglucosamine mutase [Armatimonadota bacterium]|nr:phosphoglucosamine mutase [bacterium]MDW8319960.1 phosphoglucosamine mutase [Armatimonadota bacterium]